MAPGRFTARLLAWYDRTRRDLPWRRTRDPWAIWVSEVMLQQTRVETVRARYEDFLAAYPTPAAWAAAGEEEVQHAWRGLGYYRRARLLQDGARAVVERHGGELPGDPDALGALPGVGAYTRGALASIAFGHPLVAIDGNVERVLARHRGITDNVKRGPGARAVREAATAVLPGDRPGDFNQALMELGATVCRPRNPECPACPVAADCVARARELQDELPVLPARRSAVAVDTALAWIPVRGGVLARRLPGGEVNAGQWELPGPGLLEPVADAAALGRLLRERFGVGVRLEPPLGSFHHGITHHRITARVHPGTLRGRRGRLEVLPAEDPSVPWTTASRKAFGLVDGALPRW